MPHSKQLLASSIILLICFGTAASQGSASRATASDFNIEVLNLDSRKHVFSIPEPPRRSGYVAHVDLKRLPEWKASENMTAETIGLRLQFWIEAGLPRIEVQAFLGNLKNSPRPYEWEKHPTTKVVARELPIDETITITEAAAFGILPFQVKVFRAQPWSVGPPQVTNKTQALTVLSVTENRPVYTLAVRNLSHKAINAVHWYGLENGKKEAGSGMSGAPLIPSGKPFEIRQRFGLAEEKIQSEPIEMPSTTREIVIAAILFSDGTFEGEVDEAAEMAAETFGERFQLTRIHRILKKISATPGQESIRLNTLRNEIKALSEEVNAKLIDELRAQFAGASEDMRNRRIKEEIANGLRFVKNDVLRDIERFERQQENVPAQVNFESWLKEMIETLGKMIPD
ncbi:MAG TPA: hypothetical protein VFR80_17000 [Pyrinomonadaceae bacterium]|nr:hypothetical protein [Pyrinomonadaceae bacterium]